MSQLLPRRTVRLRLTALYGMLFLASGAVLLAIASGVAVSRTSVATVPVDHHQQTALAQAQTRIQQLQHELAAQAHVHADLSRSLLLGSAIALGVMTVVSLVLGWGIAGRVLRPLREITAATRRISADSLHERLAVTGARDELTDLADTIDGLLARLESAFAAQRRFAANAAHELRTPLATMRARVDVAAAKPGPVPEQTIGLAHHLRAELDRVDDLLDGLLALARAQHGVLPDRTVISLSDAVSASLTARADAITAKNLAVRHSGTGAVRVTGSGPLLSRMADNVIGNAVSHNAPGGWIAVSVTADEELARLVVENGGPVLDHAQIAQLAQPFRRIGHDRTGSGSGAGLGLSIVAAVTDAHGGTLHLHARPEGGLRVVITLPLAGQPALAGVPR